MMSETSRRTLLRAGLGFMAVSGTGILSLGCNTEQDAGVDDESDDTSSNNQEPNEDQSNSDSNNANNEDAMQIRYLEIVTTDVDAMCNLHSKLHGVTFAEADQNLGGARTAKLADGGMLGIRAPLRATEEPIVRPYLLVDDIDAAVEAAGDAGAEIAIPPMDLPGHGRFAIVIQDSINLGFWED